MYLGVLHTEHWKGGPLFLQAGKNNVFLMEVKIDKGMHPFE